MKRSSQKKIFIGVAWPYANGDLHIGHLAGYLLPADIFARFQRYIKNKVLMVSGSDCYGTPITLEAEKRKTSPQKIASFFHQRHKKLFKLYNLSFDIFTKTTTKTHQEVVQTTFLNLVKNGYIKKKVSFQYFSPKEKRFLPDRYVEGICPFCKYPKARGDQCDKCGRTIEEGKLVSPKSTLSKTNVILKETEHYYLDFKKLKNFFLKYVEKKGKKWRKWVLKETKGWLKKGIRERCITRDIEWGVKIPTKHLPKTFWLKDVSNKRFYVWFEAVMGYLSASIEWAKKTKKDWKQFWYSQKDCFHYYFMGKDNLVFHTLFLPGQLYGAFKTIHLPDFPIINHFLTLNGKAFSKSRNIFVDAKYIGEKYGVDAVRFYLAFIMPQTADSDFNWVEFGVTVNNVLIGTFGNFLNRVLSLAKKKKGFLKENIEKEVKKKVEKYLTQARNFLLKCDFKSYVRTLLKIAQFGNKYLEKTSPWRLERDSKEFEKIITNALFLVLALHLASQPLIPQSNEKLRKLLGIKKIETWPEKNTTEYLAKFLSQINIKKVERLFKKIDIDEIKKEESK